MKNLLFFTFVLHSFNLLADTTIVALNRVHHSFGNSGNNRVIIDTLQFPQDINSYSEITMSVNLECPNGGCDPWDRKAQISIYNFNDWFEIGRYVTPYGVECGWSFDVTDYRSLLKENVIIRSYIDTWVEPGWLVSITFNFISGVPEYPNVTVRKVWNYSNLVYGDDNNPIEIPSYNGYIPSDVNNALLRMVTTGHGQGNTDNAAEFSYKLQDIYLDDTPTFVHNFWRSDCESNDCSPQNGSWTYDRAGFCPGDKIYPVDFNLLDALNPGEEMKIDYVLQEYYNSCSPNNPACVDGITCTECNYNYNGHTEPFYFIESQLIFHTTNPHSNADVLLKIVSQDPSNKTIDIYMENFVPIYGLQFKVTTLDQDNSILSALSIINNSGGRAENENWTISTNDSGLVMGLSQYFGNYIPPGEGILTTLTYSNENILQSFDHINISELQTSGYFGSSLTNEVGLPFDFEQMLDLEELNIVPYKNKLLSSYPNPFNPVITIPFELYQNELTHLSIFDVMGKEISILIDDKDKARGLHQIKWDASNFPSGLYFVMIQAGSLMESKKIILIK